MHRELTRTVGLLACLVAGSCKSNQEKLPLAPKEQVEELMNEGMSFAERMLRDRGEFFPFGLVRKSDGSIQYVNAANGREAPPSKDLIHLVDQGFRSGAESGEYAATAIFIDVLTTPPGTSSKTDAVQVGLEHRSGYCVDVFIPYQRSPDGTVHFGEIFASQRESSVFDCK